MNCIFVTVFNQVKYVDMFYLLLESLLLYGKLDDIHILVYTSTKFMNMIKESHLFNEQQIKFEINDTYNNIDKACKARLDLFKLPSINSYHYQKILYLDTDILVKADIKPVFSVCQEDLVYTLEEGTITCNSDNWGKKLFSQQEINNTPDKSAFSSGILLFNNCKKIKTLFNIIKADIEQRPFHFVCYDQPYIVYNCFKYKMYNNKALKALVVNKDFNIHSNKIIHHFPGGPGVYQRKIVSMTDFFDSLKKYRGLQVTNK